jgi:hypothetical protein
MGLDTTTWIILLSILILLVGGVVFFLRGRRSAEPEFYYFRCPACKRKLRYLARQAGHKGMCNSCKGQFTFPTKLNAAR